jgi:hypothetical protein
MNVPSIEADQSSFPSELIKVNGYMKYPASMEDAPLTMNELSE